MTRLENRVDKVAEARKPGDLILHVMPGQTEGKVRAAYERRHGKIPEDARVVVILHTFKSAL